MGTQGTFIVASVTFIIGNKGLISKVVVISSGI